MPSGLHAQSALQIALAAQRALCHAFAKSASCPHSTATACASLLAGAVALAAAGLGPGKSCAGRGRHFRAWSAHHRFHSSGRVGCSAQFATSACMAVVPPGVWRHAAQLGTGRLRGAPCQVERHRIDGAVRRCHLGRPFARVDRCRGNRLHGTGAGVAVDAS